MAVYELGAAARLLNLLPTTLYDYVTTGRIEAYRRRGRMCFDEAELVRYYMEHSNKKEKSSKDAWARRFDRRYGRGAADRIQIMYDTMSYADIGREFGISEELARRIRFNLHPEERREGYNRRRARATSNAQREAYEGDSIETFYKAARKLFGPGEIELVRRDGERIRFRKKAVKLAGRRVVIKRAFHHTALEQKLGGTIYTLRDASEESDYIFYILAGDNYLFVPASTMPRSTDFTDSKASKYYRFKNNFSALPTIPSARQ